MTADKITNQHPPLVQIVQTYPAADIASDLPDLADTPLADVAKTLGDDDAAETVRRVVPSDGSGLLVAASFNSAI